MRRQSLAWTAHPFEPLAANVAPRAGHVAVYLELKLAGHGGSECVAIYCGVQEKKRINATAWSSKAGKLRWWQKPKYRDKTPFDFVGRKCGSFGGLEDRPLCFSQPRT